MINPVFHLADRDPSGPPSGVSLDLKSPFRSPERRVCVIVVEINFFSGLRWAELNKYQSGQRRP